MGNPDVCLSMCGSDLETCFSHAIEIQIAQSGKYFLDTRNTKKMLTLVPKLCVICIREPPAGTGWKLCQNIRILLWAAVATSAHPNAAVCDMQKLLDWASDCWSHSCHWSR